MAGSTLLKSTICWCLALLLVKSPQTSGQVSPPYHKKNNLFKTDLTSRLGLFHTRSPDDASRYVANSITITFQNGVRDLLQNPKVNTKFIQVRFRSAQAADRRWKKVGLAKDQTEVVFPDLEYCTGYQFQLRVRLRSGKGRSGNRVQTFGLGELTTGPEVPENVVLQQEAPGRYSLAWDSSSSCAKKFQVQVPGLTQDLSQNSISFQGVPCAKDQMVTIAAYFSNGTGMPVVRHISPLPDQVDFSARLDSDLKVVAWAGEVLQDCETITSVEYTFYGKDVLATDAPEVIYRFSLDHHIDFQEEEVPFEALKEGLEKARLAVPCHQYQIQFNATYSNGQAELLEQARVRVLEEFLVSTDLSGEFLRQDQMPAECIDDYDEARSARDEDSTQEYRSIEEILMTDPPAETTTSESTTTTTPTTTSTTNTTTTTSTTTTTTTAKETDIFTLIEEEVTDPLEETPTTATTPITTMLETTPEGSTPTLIETTMEPMMELPAEDASYNDYLPYDNDDMYEEVTDEFDPEMTDNGTLMGQQEEDHHASYTQADRGDSSGNLSDQASVNVFVIIGIVIGVCVGLGLALFFVTATRRRGGLTGSRDGPDVVPEWDHEKVRQPLQLRSDMVEATEMTSIIVTNADGESTKM